MGILQRLALKGKNGKSYRDLQQSELKLALRTDEILTISELETTVRHEKERRDAALRENGVLKACREELYKKTAEYEASNKDISEGVSRKLRPRKLRPRKLRPRKLRPRKLRPLEK